jgi:23S rRNA pseudouridine1911/1915/1917 synthase
VHRIDKDTSGLLVVAKSDAAHQGLAAQFKAHTIERRYIAFTYGAPSRSDPRIAGLQGVAFEDGGVIRVATNIARHKTDRKRMAVVNDAGRHAITRMTLTEGYGPVERPYAGRIECWLETGRTHQIRVHANHLGHGMIGDPIYGKRKSLPMNVFSDDDRAFIEGFTRQALHAATIGFIHPISKKLLRFTSELPKVLVQLQRVLQA